MERNVQFPSILQRLIAEHGLKGNQAQLAREVNVSPSLLSQYMGGRTKPSFGALLELASYFKVSLDFLVFGELGETRESVDYGPVARHFELALQELYGRIRERDAVRERIHRRLLWSLDNAIEAAISKGIVAAGALDEEEIARVEQSSRQIDLLVPNLQEDVIDLPSGDYVGGLFVPVVAENLKRGRPYKFLMPDGRQDWGSVVGKLRRLISSQVSYERTSALCEFRTTKEPIYAGFGIYEVEADLLATNDPALHAAITPYMGENDRFAFLQPMSGGFRGAAMLDATSATDARIIFDRMWEAGAPL